MAGLAEQAAASLLRIVEPVIGRDRGVHAIDELGRPRRGAHLVLEPARELGERPVEPDREAVVLGTGHPDVVDLLAREAERLLDEDGLAGPKSWGGDLGVRVVPRADQDE